jgi:uncharacterized protein
MGSEPACGPGPAEPSWPGAGRRSGPASLPEGGRGRRPSASGGALPAWKAGGTVRVAGRRRCGRRVCDQPARRRSREEESSETDTSRGLAGARPAGQGQYGDRFRGPRHHPGSQDAGPPRGDGRSPPTRGSASSMIGPGPHRLRTTLWVLGWPARVVLTALIRVYRATLAGLLGGQCRFHPSCSAYAEEAIRTHGAVKGVGLAAWRILRCSPLSRGGWDPVPPRRSAASMYDAIIQENRAGEAA